MPVLRDFLLYRTGLSAHHFYVRSRGRLSPRVMDAAVSPGQLKTRVLSSVPRDGPKARALS